MISQERKEIKIYFIKIWNIVLMPTHSPNQPFHFGESA